MTPMEILDQITEKAKDAFSRSVRQRGLTTLGDAADVEQQMHTLLCTDLGSDYLQTLAGEDGNASELIRKTAARAINHVRLDDDRRRKGLPVPIVAPSIEESSVSVESPSRTVELTLKFLAVLRSLDDRERFLVLVFSAMKLRGLPFHEARQYVNQHCANLHVSAVTELSRATFYRDLSRVKDAFVRQLEEK